MGGWATGRNNEDRRVGRASKPEADVSEWVAAPIIGRVVGGPPLLAEEDVVGEIPVSSMIARCRRYMTREVNSDGVKDAGSRARRCTELPAPPNLAQLPHITATWCSS